MAYKKLYVGQDLNKIPAKNLVLEVLGALPTAGNTGLVFNYSNKPYFDNGSANKELAFKDDILTLLAPVLKAPENFTPAANLPSTYDGSSPTKGSTWIMTTNGTLKGDMNGTITASNSATLTGTNTTFTSNLEVGDQIEIASTAYTVISIASDTSLTIDTAITASSATYKKIVNVSSQDLLVFKGSTFTAGSFVDSFVVDANKEDATVVRKGVVRLATLSEVQTGTEGNAVVTPSTLAGKLDGKKYASENTSLSSGDNEITHGLASKHITFSIWDSAGNEISDSISVKRSGTDPTNKLVLNVSEALTGVDIYVIKA